MNNMEKCIRYINNNLTEPNKTYFVNFANNSISKRISNAVTKALLYILIPFFKEYEDIKQTKVYKIKFGDKNKIDHKVDKIIVELGK